MAAKLQRGQHYGEVVIRAKVRVIRSAEAAYLDQIEDDNLKMALQAAANYLVSSQYSDYLEIYDPTVSVE